MNQSSVLLNGTNLSCPQPSSGQVIAHTLAYVVLLVVALLGNLLVIAVVYSNKTLHNIINCFILNMSLSDLIVPIVIVPHKLIVITTGSNKWLIHGSIGDFLCKFVFYLADITPSVSILSLVFMTGDRFYAVFYPMKAALIRKSHRIALVVLTWLIPMIFFSPYFKSLEVKQIGNQYACLFQWPIKSHIIFSSTTCVVYIIIPFAILIVLYSLILGKLRGRVLTGEDLQQQKTRREKTNIAVIKLAFVVILVFALCWGPYNSTVLIYSFVWHFKLPRHLECIIHTVTVAVIFIALSNSAINPFIYFTLNNKFREGLRKTLRRVLRRPTRRSRYENKSAALEVISAGGKTCSSLEPLNRRRLEENHV